MVGSAPPQPDPSHNFHQPQKLLQQHPAGSEAPPSLPALSYKYDSGVWFHGYFFPSYEALMAYRRTAIAYNYHFFGIRPEFKPPSNLPRPRVPQPVVVATPQHDSWSAAVSAAAAAAASASAVAAAGTPTATEIEVSAQALKGQDALQEPRGGQPGAGLGPGAGANVAGGPRERHGVPEQGESTSPCCSPGGSSACSNLDSDDISDVCRRDVAEAHELLLLREHHAATDLEDQASAAVAGAALATNGALARLVAAQLPSVGTGAGAAPGAGPAEDGADAGMAAELGSLACGARGGAVGGNCDGILARAMANHDLRDVLDESPSKRVAREGGSFSWGCAAAS
ncbi:hypothetical protein GPECTOR_2g1027 [Gonium pectorale]|uniref:Uncharacterized protein n=1 Tax=Gonium pectorale TaxID=33097 RepID=A0A150H0T4_GONPE|nr:hypothetical protein GPECTOR_2g1027 [Gonium pectorale]|eukprot:KXZ55478.1 hypothetical protein GPECTOR_2g1027 [Gonium pectorale]